MRPGCQTLPSSQTVPEEFVSSPPPPVPDAAAGGRTRPRLELAPVRWRSYESRDLPTRRPGSASAPARLPLLPPMALHTPSLSSCRWWRCSAPRLCVLPPATCVRRPWSYAACPSERYRLPTETPPAKVLRCGPENFLPRCSSAHREGLRPRWWRSSLRRLLRRARRRDGSGSCRPCARATPFQWPRELPGGARRCTPLLLVPETAVPWPCPNRCRRR